MKFNKWRNPYSLCCGSDISSVYFALYTRDLEMSFVVLWSLAYSHSLLASHLSQ